MAIAQKCKFKISATAAKNAINKEDEYAFNTSFTHAGIGESERLYREESPPPISQMTGYGEGLLAKC